MALCWILAGSISVAVASAAPSPPEPRTRISIQADNAPLRDILRRVSELADFSLSLLCPTSEPVSLSLEDSWAPEALRLLLREYNYVMLYNNDSGRLSKVIVVSRKNPVRQDQPATAPELLVTVRKTSSPPVPAGESDTQPAATDDAIFLPAGRDSFSALPAGDLLTDARLTPTPVSVRRNDGFFQTGQKGRHRSLGLRLTRLPEKSPLRLLGLRPADVVREVNGTAIQSAADLNEALRNTLTDRQTNPLIIGIERPAAGGGTDISGPPGETAPDSSMTAMHIYVTLTDS